MEKIFVSIRVRPLSKVEAAKGSPWKLGSNSITLCNSTGAPVPGQSYVFDKVFGSETSTLELYETHTKDIIASAVKGFNGTVFAYGQTSSGKTYTMRGCSREPGIIPLAVQEIFRNIEEAEDREFLLRVSYMEIYNEEINDLLAPENRKLQVHENIERGIFVAGLREEIVVSPEQVLELMTAGETYRHVGETNMNVYSSRSHSIFRMVIESRDRSHDDPAGPASVQSCDAVRVSVLNLVDLAGSERVAKTGAEGARLKEGTHINKSLMTLGTVINKLSEGVEKQGGHVPYRDSKLTRILQPALGGNAKTGVICNITPAQIHVDETKGTLFFASRANRVTNCAQVNEIMTDAALLKRQTKEIEELRNKLQENHSEHWDAEILNLRNALLKTELERERMALELQQEKAAQAERERRLKEQEQKIENLSTMVINSAVDDRDIDKRNKKNNRRETWCPRIPSIERNEQWEENKILFPKESLPVKSMFSTRRERLPPLPPPFESLTEGESTVSTLLESNENTFGEEFQSLPSDGSNLDSIFQEPPPVLFCERKRRSTEKPMDDDLRRQLGDLQVQYDDLQLQHELKMREKMLEMKELKEELAFAQSSANKARKLDNMANEVEGRTGTSLDGWESDGNVQQLRAQIQNLELEKFHMQNELDTLKVQATTEASSAQSNLKVQQELEEAREDAVNAKVSLYLALQEISDLRRDQQFGIEQQAALAAQFNELTLEVEITKSSSQAFYDAAVDSTNALRATLMNLQETVIGVKSLRAPAENQHFDSLQSDIDALEKEHDSLISVLQAVRKERDAFCEVSKAAQADLKSLEEEIRGKNDELAATESDLLAANKQVVDAENKIAELHSLLTQRESQEQALEQSIKDLESEAVSAISKGHKEKLEERIMELEQELEVVCQEKAGLICKGEAMYATIQVLEGEKDALIETSRQAQADIDRLQGKRRQELKEAQDKLETALSESYHTKEQLIAIRSLLTEKTEEQQTLQFKLENLQREATTSTKALEESIQTLEAQLAHKSMEFESARQEYEELVASYEAINREKSETLETQLSHKSLEFEESIQTLETQLAHKSMEFESSREEYEALVASYEAINREKSELSEVCNRSKEEVNRLCRELDIQGEALAEAEKTLESERVQRLKDETQLPELRLTLSEQIVDIEALQFVLENLQRKTTTSTKALEESIQTLETQLAHKSMEFESFRQEYEALIASYEAINKEKSELSEVCNRSKEEVDRLCRELDVQGQALAEAEKKLEAERVQSSKNETQLSELRLTLSEQIVDIEALTCKVANLSAEKSAMETSQQQHNTELSQLKSDILGLRKELKAAKAAPGALEKERDGLRKDLEKLKSKLGDIEAKLKSTLIEKNKVETEKLNIEREVKQLRQSTALLNKRESLVDKRRESVACGLNKTKQQLSSTEHALQLKNNELEKTAFDLQLLQDNYAKLEADMVETENISVILRNKLAEAESVISDLRDEKGAATSTIETISQKLEDELEQERTTVAQLDALRSEHAAMMEKLLTFQVASQKAEAGMKSISLERDDLARQLTDAHFGFEEEKAAWASQVGQSDAKVQELQQEIVNLSEELEKVQKAREEVVAERNTLQEQLDEAEHIASTVRVALQEQLSKLEHCLQRSEQESNQLRQQVELLSSSVKEQVELERKLQEELLAGKEQYEALKDEFENLKVLLVVSEADIQRERQSIVDLAEEVKQPNRMLQEAEQKCANLYERNADFEAVVRKEPDERMQLLEERRALADRCILFEGKISQLEVSIREGRENESRLLQEIHELKGELRNNMEASAQQRKSEVSHRAIELEAAWNNDREVAQKQVEKLQSQLKMSKTDIESLQNELDVVGMKVRDLYLELDVKQAALDESRTEKFTLKQQLADLTARLSSLEDINEQLQKKETHLLQLNKAYLTSKTKLQSALDATGGRLEIFQFLCERLEEAMQELDEHKTAATEENGRLLVKLQNLKSRCQRYEEDLREAKSKRISPEEEQERQNQIAEIMQQNSALQLRLQKSEEIAKARREEMMKLHEVVQRKGESNSELEAALEKAQGQVLKLERDLYQKIESQTTERKVDGSAMSSMEFVTPMAPRHGQDDANHMDDTNTLYSNSLASRSKVEQLKLQSQSLLRMYKQPWRIQGSPGGSADETGDHPPPSATLDSHHENLTAPIPTWKRAKTAGATSNAEFLQPSVSASAFNTRSVPRAALVPVNTQNKLHALVSKRLQESGTQVKLPVQGTDEAEIKPSVSSTHMPRSFRFNQRFEKENL